MKTLIDMNIRMQRKIETETEGGPTKPDAEKMIMPFLPSSDPCATQQSDFLPFIISHVAT